jgi:hypothetical protein
MKKYRSGSHIALLIASFVSLALACRLPSLANILPLKNSGLKLDPRGADGRVSGVFTYPRGEGRETLNFYVSADGLAGFLLEGASEDEILTVDLRQKESAQMSWKSEDLDGWGEMTRKEEWALKELMESTMAYGIAQIPLDLACQGEDIIDPVQLAALLFPLQMRFKYLEGSRGSLASELASLSECNYGEDSTNGENPSLIMMMPSSPIPVVLGYFPFDPVGAVEGMTTGSNGLTRLALPVWSHLIGDPMLLKNAGIDGFGLDLIRDEWGPCEAKCRGACGPDCTTRNCIMSVDNRCEKNQDGENDGFWSMIYIYDCGLHPACIEHDACYDDCNQRYGCGSFAAAFCMHSEAIATMPFEYFSGTYLSCDSKVLVEQGLSNAFNWMQGYGTFTGRQVFEYTDPKYRNEYDPVDCPLPGETAPEGDITQPEEDQPPGVSENVQPPEESSPDIPEVVSTIPVGVYLGEIEFRPEMMEYAESAVSDVTIIIEEDGSVTGSFGGQVIDTPYNYGYSYQWTMYFVGTFSGMLTDRTGTIQSSETFYNSVITDDPLMETENFSYIRNVTITVDGDKLIGVTAACPEKPNEPIFILTFVTEKFE